MPDDIDRRSLDAARRSLAGAKQAHRRLKRELVESEAEVERLRRTLGPDDDRVRGAAAEQAKRERELERARSAVVNARGALATTLGEWVDRDPGVDLGRLRAEIPIVMFPIRIETRFQSTDHGSELLVRVYPDTIHGTAHDPLLTLTERDAGIAYWRRAWVGEEAQAWRELLSKLPAPRAAWIVQSMVPTNLPARPLGEPVFPQVELRTDAWDVASEASLLPDRWLMVAYRDGTEVRRAFSRPVREPLVVGFDPHAPAGSGVDISGDGLEIDAELLWAVDFARAEEEGMALRVALAAEDMQHGFDRLLILGVKGSMSPEDGQGELEKLFDAHHYSGGFALIPQGAPTNNSEGSSSSYPPPDPDGARSFAVERGAPLDVSHGDGVHLTRALGLVPGLVRHIEGADRREQASARAMNQALWPATFGYYLQQMLAPHVGSAAIELGRHHFVDHVRGRGPLPAFRVRAQPYGALPVTSLDRWQPRREANRADIQIPALLRRLRPVWQAQIENVHRVGRTADPDADLLGILGLDASTREVRVRTVHGPDFQLNFFAFIGVSGASWRNMQAAITQPLMPLIGFPDWDPRINHMSLANTARRFRFPLVAPAPLAEDQGLEAAFGFDYIRWIRTATIEDLRAERLPEERETPTALLYRMLRHARLLEIARVGIDLGVEHGLAISAHRHEPELVGIAGDTAGRATPWERLAQPIPALTGTRSLGDFLLHDDAPETTTLRAYDVALAALEGLPTAELERLFGETLDLCSHRLDAWVTSLATKRLGELRAVHPAGAYVGAFGWVEGLVPVSAARSRTEVLPDGRKVRVPVNGGGYIHAPSMQHASAAAVLRNGYLTRSGEAGAAFAVDLSSERVRTALSILDAVRAGQPLGAVLGYRFERGLHERAVDWFIEPLRSRFPAVANKSGDTDLEGPSDAIAARNVVDGLALRHAWSEVAIDLTHSDFHRSGAPPSVPELDAVETELRRLDEALDAVTDLLTAESVYQLVGGNTAGANAGLDATAKGTRPPDPVIAQQPRSGIPLTHRVGLILGGDPLVPTGWSAGPTPRSLAEPWIDGWAGQLLGDPTIVRCRVEFAIASSDSTPPVVLVREVTLDALGLRPIDVLALARAASEDTGSLSELDQRIIAVALGTAPPGARVKEIRYARAEGWSRDLVRTFPEIFAVAQAIDRLLAASRPMAAADLAPPEAKAEIPDPDPLWTESIARADQARMTLDAAKGALASAIASSNSAALRAALGRATLMGVTGAWVGRDTPDTAIVERAEVVHAELARRMSEATSASEPVAIARAVFGSDFPFLPRFTPPLANELGLALAANPALVGDPEAPARWIYQAARVRIPLAKWRALALRARALGSPQGALDVIQLPHQPGARWVALPFAAGDEPKARTLSLVLSRLSAPPPTASWVGLLIDEWNEIVPDPAPQTGIAFHYDSPGAEPPQTVLIAVPASNADRWELEELVAILNETLDLAKMRAVDGELLGALGQLTPAVYLAANVENDTISTDFVHALTTELPLVAGEG